jgi:putative transcription factor
MLDVCANCVAYGREAVLDASPSARSLAPQKEFEVVDGFGPIVLSAITRMGKAPDDYARTQFINADYLRQIIAGKRVPDEKTARKLEKALGITLVVESAAQGAAVAKAAKGSGEFTLADVAQIRKGKK